MIRRDGDRTSLWQQQVAEFPSTLTSTETRFDVAIVGGGITGLTTGLLLQQRGKSCIVFESHNLCFGTTGGTTAHINTLFDVPYSSIMRDFGKDKALLVARAAKDAVGLINAHVSEFNINCGFQEAMGYIFSQNDEETNELDNIYDACLQVGVDVQFINSLPMAMPYEKILMVKNQAKFSPTEYVYGIARAFEQAGGVIRQQCRVNNLMEDDKLQIDTNQGTFTAGNVVYATHIPPGVNILHLRCVPYRSYVLAARLNSQDYPDGLIYGMKDPYHYYRTHNVDGINYLIAGGNDHKTAHEELTTDCFRNLEQHVRQYFDIATITHQWSSQFYEPVDGLAYIGHYPAHHDNVFVATGFGGNGMTYSHIAARILADKISGESNDYEDLFRPARVKPVAGFTGFVSHNADVVRQFVQKFVAPEELEGLDSLSPGEGKIVRHNEDKIAICKDPNGEVHAVNPTCTHLGCSVVWNSAEQSWDCPCHGARYSMDGTVLNGPADKDLEVVKVTAEKAVKGEE